ncbi:MAG: trimethylamine methyltransferase family protein, partial [Planctomycetes bacterium]|nr:trimethylamine methyltransferase family protein [Planctomycetota bacterium]
MIRQIHIETSRPTLHMLCEDQVQAIHHSSLDILSRTGIVMQHDAARARLVEAGAWESEGRLKIPPHLVTDAIASAPSRIPMHDRLGQLT